MVFSRFQKIYTDKERVLGNFIWSTEEKRSEIAQDFIKKIRLWVTSFRTTLSMSTRAKVWNAVIGAKIKYFGGDFEFNKKEMDKLDS